MSRPWDFHDFNDPDDDPVTRFRHLGGDFGPYDPSYWGFDSLDEDDDDEESDSDDSFSDVGLEAYQYFEEDQKKYPRNSRDKVRRTPAGPMIALYDTRYFVPQWDEQMLGPAWRQKRGKWDFDNPPKALSITDPKMKDAFKYCEECQLTWLVGYDKVERHQHPQHLAWGKGPEDTDIHRLDMDMETSIVIHIHGERVPQGQRSLSPIIGHSTSFGIFFGKGSKYNVGAPYGIMDDGDDAESAALSAVELAITIVGSDILRDREDFFKKFAKSRRADEAKAEAALAKTDEKGASSAQNSVSDDVVARPKKDEDDPWEDESDDDEYDDGLHALPFRVILVLDHAMVVDNICKHIKQWKDEKGILFTKKGKPAKHGDMYQRVEDTVLGMGDDYDTNVKWYHVPKEHNQEAAKLAQDALRGTFTGLESEI
ncbi:hypothetical protein F4804DRAFT_311626 [Jackrogersella minutella]|nr:hypothetical protein F4804DRAFT_311626 [Jackrogersella minutella]